MLKSFLTLLIMVISNICKHIFEAILRLITTKLNNNMGVIFTTLVSLHSQETERACASSTGGRGAEGRKAGARRAGRGNVTSNNAAHTLLNSEGPSVHLARVCQRSFSLSRVKTCLRRASRPTRLREVGTARSVVKVASLCDCAVQ